MRQTFFFALLQKEDYIVQKSKAMKTPLRFLEEVAGLFYPNLCLACQQHLPSRHSILCVQCQYQLPKTNYHLHAENSFTERFWGRVPLHAGTALYHFTKGGKVQHLIHALKYEHKPDVGICLGRLLGEQLHKSPLFSDVDVIVPVPLHPRKEWERGYNQSDCFARGLSEAMEIPWRKRALLRSANTATQTRKSRIDRVVNVGTAFSIGEAARLSGRHVLLVDDVVTTGATLEACGLLLQELAGLRLSMATIAIADA